MMNQIEAYRLRKIALGYLQQLGRNKSTPEEALQKAKLNYARACKQYEEALIANYEN